MFVTTNFPPNNFRFFLTRRIQLIYKVAKNSGYYRFYGNFYIFYSELLHPPSQQSLRTAFLAIEEVKLTRNSFAVMCAFSNLSTRMIKKKFKNACWMFLTLCTGKNNHRQRGCKSVIDPNLFRRYFI